MNANLEVAGIAGSPVWESPWPIKLHIYPEVSIALVRGSCPWGAFLGTAERSQDLECGGQDDQNIDGAAPKHGHI